MKAGFPIPLEVGLQAQPEAVRFGTTWVLVYELLVANPTADTLQVSAVEIRSTGGSRPTWVLEGPSLHGTARRIPPLLSSKVTDREGASLTLAPGERYLLYLWLELAGDESPPNEISHLFRVASAEASEGVRPLDGPSALVRRRAPTLSAPVRGGRWLVGNGFANNSDHRRWFSVVGGLVIPQRFGADFLKLDKEGRNAADDSLDLASFYAYGEPLYAVADGRVVRVRDGLPDQAVGEAREGLDWSTVPGNHVLLEIGPEHFVLYAHLQPGSVAVKTGDQVQRGQLVGRIGNSGNSATPHLHFHIQSTAELNETPGSPFHFEAFELLVEDYRFQPEKRPLPESGATLRACLPRKGWVVRFPKP